MKKRFNLDEVTIVNLCTFVESIFITLNEILDKKRLTKHRLMNRVQDEFGFTLVSQFKLLKSLVRFSTGLIVY